MKRIKPTDKNVSPYVRRLRLMELSGIQLSKKQQKRLLNESVGMILPPPKHERDKVKNSMIWNGNDISDIEDEDEDDELFDEILREMGYGEDEEDEEYDIQTMTSSEIKELIRSEVKDYFDNTFENPDDLDLNEIIENITKN